MTQSINFTDDFFARTRDSLDGDAPTPPALSDEQQDVITQFALQHDAAAPARNESTDALFDILGIASTESVMRSVSIGASMARVRQAMSISLDDYNSWRSYNFFGYSGRDDTDPEKKLLLESLEAVNDVKFKHMSGLQLAQVFDATCRLCGVAHGSADYLTLRDELVEPRLAALRKSLAERREELGLPVHGFDAEAVAADAKKTSRWAVLGGVVGYAVLAAAIFGFGIMVGKPTARERDRLAIAQERATRMLNLLTNEQLVALYKQETGDALLKKSAGRVMERYMNEHGGVVPASAPVAKAGDVYPAEAAYVYDATENQLLPIVHALNDDERMQSIMNQVATLPASAVARMASQMLQSKTGPVHTIAQPSSAAAR
jgi:hypothetical protein